MTVASVRHITPDRALLLAEEFKNCLNAQAFRASGTRLTGKCRGVRHVLQLLRAGRHLRVVAGLILFRDLRADLAGERKQLVGI